MFSRIYWSGCRDSNPAFFVGEAFRPEAKEFLARENSTRLRDFSR
jgi:hypothetical protein